jgi:DNA-binding MarR family transcriptional regulator
VNPTDPLTHRWHSFNQFHYRVVAHVDRYLDEHLGLTYREFHALTLVGQYSRTAAKNSRLQEISEGVGLSQSATSRLIGRLDARGLISKRADWRDRRGVDVRLTEAAQELLRRGTPLLHQAVRSAVAASRPYARQPELARYFQDEAGLDAVPVADQGGEPAVGE